MMNLVITDNKYRLSGVFFFCPPVPLYHHVGCFLDKPSRALPYSGSNFNSGTPAERINNCAVLSAHRGHDTFGVQLGGQCFTGNDARYTYRLYGQGDGCKDGLGGVMRNDVYFLGESVVAVSLKVKCNVVALFS